MAKDMKSDCVVLLVLQSDLKRHTPQPLHPYRVDGLLGIRLSDRR